MNDKKITNTSEVWAHMTIELMDGSVADSTRVNRKPMILRLGQEELSAAFEENLLGLQEGHKKEFVLEAKDAFGLPNPANLHRLPRSQFADTLKLRLGLIIEFAQMNGCVIPGVVREFDDNTVLIDFNHPLCGQQLKFKIEIVSIAPHDENKMALI